MRRRTFGGAWQRRFDVSCRYHQHEHISIRRKSGIWLADKTVTIGDSNTLRFTDGGGLFRSHPVGTQNTEGMRWDGGSMTAGSSNAPATLYVWKNSTIAEPPTLPSGEEANLRSLQHNQYHRQSAGRQSYRRIQRLRWRANVVGRPHIFRRPLHQPRCMAHRQTSVWHLTGGTSLCGQRCPSRERRWHGSQ